MRVKTYVPEDVSNEERRREIERRSNVVRGIVGSDEGFLQLPKVNAAFCLIKCILSNLKVDMLRLFFCKLTIFEFLFYNMFTI